MEPQTNEKSEHEIVKNVIVMDEEPELNEETPNVSPKKPILTLPAAVLTGFVILALAILFVVPGMTKTATQEPSEDAPTTPTSVDKDIVTLRSGDHVKGDASSADILLFTYSDSDCPFCARFHPTVQSILTDYKGRVAWVYRQFPLEMHPNAYTEALALECAAQLGGDKAFFSYLDTVVNVTLNADPKSNEALTTFAKNEGIDANQFKSCLAEASVTNKIDADIAEANKIGARGTPFSIAVNKKTGEQVVIPGAYPLDAVKQMIDGIL
jgi:protein-disulfide isomerase